MAAPVGVGPDSTDRTVRSVRAKILRILGSELDPWNPWEQWSSYMKDDLGVWTMTFHRFRAACTFVSLALLLAACTASTLPASPSRQSTSGSSNASGQPVPSAASEPSPSTSPPPTLTWIRMVNSKAGWAEAGNHLLRTEDGGDHWIDVTPPELDSPTQVVVPDSGTHDSLDLWVGVSDSNASDKPAVVLHTHDGGRSWTRTALPESGDPSPYFTDPSHGWVYLRVGAAEGTEFAHIYRTTDGGAHWTLVQKRTGSDTSGMTFRDRTTGYIGVYCPASGCDVLEVTHDGGRTWTQQQLPIPPDYAEPSRDEEPAFATFPPVFFTSSDGIIAAQPTDGIVVFYVSHDGGRHWTPTTPIRTESAHQVWDFTDAEHGWTTDGTRIYSTADSGRHWRTIDTQVPLNAALQVDFVDDQVGWLLSADDDLATGNIWRTVDGGKTWTKLAVTVGR